MVKFWLNIKICWLLMVFELVIMFLLGVLMLFIKWLCLCLIKVDDFRKLLGLSSCLMCLWVVSLLFLCCFCCCLGLLFFLILWWCCFIVVISFCNLIFGCVMSIVYMVGFCLLVILVVVLFFICFGVVLLMKDLCNSKRVRYILGLEDVLFCVLVVVEKFGFSVVGWCLWCLYWLWCFQWCFCL